jgi:hypothetical protein
MIANPTGARPLWRWAFWALAAAGFAVVLALNLPGQMSTDSVMQLYEGRTDRQITFNPWIMSWMLGLSDRMVPGTGLFMLLNAALLFASLAALPLLRPGRTSGWAVAVMAAVLLTPQIVNYQGIVWKDVLFANLVIAGFVSLALGLRWSDRAALRWAAFGKAALFLALAALVRQNGAIAALMAALALGLVQGRRLGWHRGLIWGAGGLTAALGLALILGSVIRPGATEIKSPTAGLRILRHYDIIGAVARDPTFDLGATPPERAAVIRAEAPRLYTPERIDTLDSSPAVTRALWQTPRAAMTDAWWSLVLERPGLYLSHRMAVFDQVLRTPRLERCLPVVVGIDGPAAIRQTLALDEAPVPQDAMLRSYAAAFQGTPVFSHLAYAVLALAVLAALATRREATDLVMMGLMIAALGFTASFLLIALACDYRYLYMLDLAALTGAVYWALDPPVLRFRRRS